MCFRYSVLIVPMKLLLSMKDLIVRAPEIHNLGTGGACSFLFGVAAFIERFINVGRISESNLIPNDSHHINSLGGTDSVR